MRNGKEENAFSHFRPISALLIGDYMLDRYTTGQVSRISPEAPVGVLRVEQEEFLPGGAGNVALNLLSLGAKVTAVGRIGGDSAGENLSFCLKERGVNIDYLFKQKEYMTPVKNRLIAGSQHLLRVDWERIIALDPILEEKIIQHLSLLIKNSQIVAISDYGKGFLSGMFISKIITQANKLNVPVIVDPKGIDFSKYRGATVIKPNVSEAYAAARLSYKESLETAAEILLSQTEAKKLIVTRSAEGMSLFDREGKRLDFPVRSKEVKDVTGAGDTVLAMIGVALANGMNISHAAQLANVAAGIAIEHIGCAYITLSDLARRLLELSAENKIFDERHLYAISQVLKGKKFSVFGVGSKKGMIAPIYRTIRHLSSLPDHELIIYVKDISPDEEFIYLLSSLKEVSYIILHSDSLKHLCDAIHPTAVFEMQGEKVVEHNHAKELLRMLSITSSPVIEVK